MSTIPIELSEPIARQRSRSRSHGSEKIGYAPHSPCAFGTVLESKIVHRAMYEHAIVMPLYTRTVLISDRYSTDVRADCDYRKCVCAFVANAFFVTRRNIDTVVCQCAVRVARFEKCSVRKLFSRFSPTRSNIKI